MYVANWMSVADAEDVRDSVVAVTRASELDEFMIAPQVRGVSLVLNDEFVSSMQRQAVVELLEVIGPMLVTDDERERMANGEWLVMESDLAGAWVYVADAEEQIKLVISRLGV